MSNMKNTLSLWNLKADIVEKYLVKLKAATETIPERERSEGHLWTVMWIEVTKICVEVGEGTKKVGAENVPHTNARDLWKRSMRITELLRSLLWSSGIKQGTEQSVQNACLKGDACKLGEDDYHTRFLTGAGESQNPVEDFPAMFMWTQRAHL